MCVQSFYIFKQSLFCIVAAPFSSIANWINVPGSYFDHSLVAPINCSEAYQINIVVFLLVGYSNTYLLYCRYFGISIYHAAKLNCYFPLSLAAAGTFNVWQKGTPFTRFQASGRRKPHISQALGSLLRTGRQEGEPLPARLPLLYST